MSLSKAQSDVVERAKRQLQSEPWYQGVCLDNVPDDATCRANPDDAVDLITFETAMYDDPDFYAYVK